jgi:hypothetical protein
VIVIFCYLPPNTSTKELLDFALSGTKSLNPFRRGAEILSHEVLDVRAPLTREEECHGLITFKNPASAKKAIQRLNGKSLKGKPIKVKPFTHRRPHSHVNTPETERRRGTLARLEA